MNLKNTLKTLNKKSILFTLDSIFALVIALIILSAVIFSLRSLSVKNWSETNINELGMDYLTILENNDMLEYSVNSQTTGELKTFLNSFLKENMCGKLRIYDSSDNMILEESKTGCVDQKSVFITKRSFVVNNNFYYAAFEGWYNE
jgi:hypothetical protein